MLLKHADLAKYLGEAGVPLARERLVPDAAEAAAVAGEWGTAVVLKLVSPMLVHKSDVGAVLLGVSGREAVIHGARRLMERAEELALEDWQILVQEMVRSTLPEVFVGLKHDPAFGPIVIVGAGGRLVELLPDRAIATCPVTDDEAAELIRGIPLGRAVGGYRGERDRIDEIAAVVSAASRLPEILPELVEADLNPIVITERGPVAVDARAAVEEGSTTGTPAPPRYPDLNALLEPESVLVVGASASGAVMPGNRVLRLPASLR